VTITHAFDRTPARHLPRGPAHPWPVEPVRLDPSRPRPIPGTSAWSCFRRRSKGSPRRPCRRPVSSTSSGHRVSRPRRSSRSATESRHPSSAEAVPPNPTPTLPAPAGWPPRPSTRSRPRSSTCRRSTTAGPVPAIRGRRSSLGARSSRRPRRGRGLHRLGGRLPARYPFRPRLPRSLRQPAVILESEER